LQYFNPLLAKNLSGSKGDRSTFGAWDSKKLENGKLGQDKGKA